LLMKPLRIFCMSTRAIEQSMHGSSPIFLTPDPTDVTAPR